MRKLLFVCVHNAGRSQMAEAFVNQMSQDLGIEVFATSAGTVGGKALNLVAIEVMREIGISMESQTPKLLTKEMVDEADEIISMGCGVDAEACPTKFLLTEDWELDDPAGRPIEEVRKIRDQIKSRVQAKLEEVGC